MKTKITTIGILGLILFGLSAFVFETKNLTKPESDYCLTISGKVLNTEKTIRKKITVYLINSNTIIDSIKTGTNLVFSFQLKKNQEYSLKIVEPRSVSRLISISTRVPQKFKNDILFQFHFDLLPFVPSPALLANPDILDFPLALIYFDPKKGSFDYNRKYTSYIKTKYNQDVFDLASN